DDDTAVLRPRPLPGQGAPGEPRIDPDSWGAAREAASAVAGRQRGEAEIPRTGGTGSAAGTGGAGPETAPDSPDPGPAPDPRPASRKRRAVMLLTGVAGGLAVIVLAAVVFGLPGGGDKTAASPSPSPTSAAADLPAGVKCQGKDCTGKDPEKMGCGGQHVKTAASASIGESVVEVRYSKLCRAAWGRITGAAQGDGLKISAAGESASDEVDTTNDAYTEMVGVTTSTEARACATLVTGTTGCTDAADADPTESAAAPTATGSP
ncbi:MAG: DUF2690 domain-containing protein, partial [Streptomyces sp.]|uniref:DUF2690 domain-containing protein n=1 Tax=Streptomyces sp. TaxID=1931 RepID=UPI003D6BA911